MQKLFNDDALDIIPNLDDLSIDLAICDPPYWKVVNQKWDYVWRTEEEYIDWVERWVSTLSKKMRFGGSLYMFGFFRTLSKLVTVFEKYGFELRQPIVIDKGLRSIAGRATKNYKMFPNTTEVCLFFIKDPHPYVKKLLIENHKKKNISSKHINESLGVKSNGGGMWSIYAGNNICKQIPTEDLWIKLASILDINIKYQSFAQTFNPIMGLNDVWTDIDFYEKNRIHPTQKPLKLIERLLLASSNQNDIVLDPFMGGGTTAVACKNLDRKFIGIELDKEYFEKTKYRLDISSHDLFTQSNCVYA